MSRIRHCAVIGKIETYGLLVAYDRQHGRAHVVDVTNCDDTGDHRPGRKAAEEYRVRSPFMEAGMTKADIRTAARTLRLPNWDKPAKACLASRLPYGRSVTVAVLGQVEQAELVLAKLGVQQGRVRYHDAIARREVGSDDFSTVLTHRKEIVPTLKRLGYAFVTLDLVGYRQGSLNPE